MTLPLSSSDADALSPSSVPADQRIGLIAGNGRFPIIFAENARRLGYFVSAIAHVGETLPELERCVDRIHWIRIGQFNKAIKSLKGDGVNQAVMLGGVKKTHVFSDVRPDFRAMALFARLKTWKDDGILREVAAELEREGIHIRESTFGLQNILVPSGILSSRAPTKKEQFDIEFGWAMAGEVGRLDIGQCLVVKDRAVLAVEAADGTDETIRRGGRLARQGAVVVKRCKPIQDLRFDLPAVGPDTISTMREVKATVLALDAGRSILLDKEAMLQHANQANIAVVGMLS